MNVKKLLSKVFSWRPFRKKPVVEPPVIVGAEYLAYYDEHWAALSDRFKGYIRANPDGAVMFKSMTPEEISRMAADSQPLFVVSARKTV
jgi:hypothetical protein